MKTLILALLAAIPAVLCLIPLDETFWEHLLKQLALKVSTKFVIGTKESVL
jgi:hypothetical protein